LKLWMYVDVIKSKSICQIFKSMKFI